MELFISFEYLQPKNVKNAMPKKKKTEKTFQIGLTENK